MAALRGSIEPKNFYFRLYDTFEDMWKVAGNATNNFTTLNRGYYTDADYNRKVEQESDFRELLGIKQKPGMSYADQITDEAIMQFYDPALKQRFLNLRETIASRTEMGGVTEKSRIKITDNPSGVFSFDLAAQGLYRPAEFYCWANKALADPLQVKHEMVGGKELYSITEDGEQKFCRRQQLGSQDIMDHCPYATLNEIREGFYVASPAKYVDPDGKEYRLKFRTNTKRVYLQRKQVGGKVKYVDLFINVGGNWRYTTENLMVRASAMILLAEKLESAGVRVRLNGIQFKAYGINRTQVYSVLAWGMKDYGEPLDINRLLVQAADSRFYRKKIWQAYNGTNRAAYGNNSPQAETQLTEIYDIDDDMQDEVWTAFRNYVWNQKERGQYRTNVDDRSLLINEQVPDSMQKTIQSNTPDIERTYEKIADGVELVLTPNVAKSAARIVQRLKDKGWSRRQMDDYFKEVLQTAFRTIEPQGKPSDYSNTPAEISTANARREEILDTITPLL